MLTFTPARRGLSLGRPAAARNKRLFSLPEVPRYHGWIIRMATKQEGLSAYVPHKVWISAGVFVPGTAWKRVEEPQTCDESMCLSYWRRRTCFYGVKLK